MSSPEERGDVPGEFERRLTYWQRVLDRGGEEAAERYGVQMINELDSLLIDAGEMCYFEGYGLAPDVSSSESPLPVAWGPIGNGKGVHNGMQLRPDEDNNPMLGYEVIVQQGGKQLSPCEYRESQLKIFLDPKRSSVVTDRRLMHDIREDDDMRIPREAAFFVLQQASDIFATAILERRFHRLSLPRQREFIDSYLCRFERDSAINGRSVAVNGVYHYPAPAAGDSRQLGEIILPFNDRTLYGKCAGLGFLGSAALHNEPIKRISDIPDRNAGICVVLEADRTQPENELVEGDLTYIPLSSQQVVFSEAATE